MQYYSEPAVCPNCGKETLYHVIVSCNSFMMNMLPSNECSCGYELSEEDIDLSKASPPHRNYVRNKKIRDYIKSNNKDNFECEKCGCTKSSGHGFVVGMAVPDKYKNNDKVTIKNGFKMCSKCGHKTFDTFESYSDLYDLIEVLDNGSFLCKKKDNYDETYKRYKEKDEKEFKEVENYLVSIGEILADEDEEDYADKYYGRHVDKIIRNSLRF